MRLHGQAKLGFYPTPPTVTERLCRLLAAPPANPGTLDGSLQPLRILDPCAGDGTALATLGRALDAQTYGVELHHARARQAKTALTICLHGDCLTATIPPQAFGLLFLNPPYDTASQVETAGDSERLELRFLRATLPALQPGGILVFLIPERRLTGRLATALAARLDELTAWRFPEPEYQAFQQIVVAGRATERTTRHDDVAAELTAIGHGQRAPDPLPPDGPPRYVVPVSHEPRPKLVAHPIDPSLLAAEIDTDGANAVLYDRLFLPTTAQETRALLPLRRGHIAMLLASGRLNGLVSHNGTRLLIKGRTKKVTTTTSESDDTQETIVETESLKITVTALDLATGSLLNIE